MKASLATVSEISDVVTSEPTGDGGTVSFKAPAGFDVDATLNKLVEGGASKLKDWSKAE